MKNLFVIVVIFITMYAPGCAANIQNENSPPVTPEINLTLPLLSMKKQPEIADDKEGVRFSWPDQEWLLMKGEDGLYAVAKDLTYRLELEPKRRQIKATPLPGLVEEESTETFRINDILPMKEGLLLVSKNNDGRYGLAHLLQIMDDELVWLVRESDELPEYILSRDRSKVVYWNLPESHLSSYHTVTGKNTTFTTLNEDQLCDDWVQHINISPQGGYLTYEVVDCPSGHPIQFTIVGADSGRLIRDNLPGVSPRWDNVDQQIIFQLLESKSMSSEEQGSQGLQQLAMYSLHTNDLTFFNRIAYGYSLDKLPLFSEDNVYLIYPVRNEKESRLVMHHIVQQLQQSLLLPEDTVIAETDHWAFMNDRTLSLLIRSESGYQLFIHYIASELTEIIDGIDHWTDKDGNNRWFKSDSDSSVYYLKDGRLMQAQDGNHHSVFNIPEDKKITDIDTWQEWLLITVITSRGEQQLYFVGL